jgi:hypothetical protein
MQKIVQTILVIWFVVVSLFLFIPGAALLLRGDPLPAAMPNPPSPPVVSTALTDPKEIAVISRDPKVIEEISKAWAQQVASYTQQVAAYKEQLAAYKVYADAAGKRQLSGAFQLVIKDTIVTLLSTFATALLGYVFVKGGAGLVNNLLLIRSGRPTEKLDI